MKQTIRNEVQGLPGWDSLGKPFSTCIRSFSFPRKPVSELSPVDGEESNHLETKQLKGV